jgi:tetratricopeptide (TPR) repeat protein
MPSRKADDIPHTSSTDHWIRVPGRPTGAPFQAPKTSGVEVAPWTSDATPIENAVAEVRRRAKTGGSEQCRLATNELERLLKKSNAADGSAWLEAAKGFFAIDDMAKAKETVARALAADPNDVAGMELYALLLSRAGDFAGSAEVTEKILKANPWYNGGDVELLRALSRTGAERRAFDLYDRYLQFHPPNFEAYLLLGEMKRRTKAPSREAAAYYNKAAKADGARPEPFVALAKLATADGSHSAAAVHAHEAALRNPTDATLWAFDAACQRQAGDRAAAISAAEKAIAIDPLNVEAKRVLRELNASRTRTP